MSANNGFHPECSEKFAELCALSVTNALTAQERQNFEHHIAGCLRCASLVAEFRSIATEGMAQEAARRDAENAEVFPFVRWDRDRAKAKFLARITSGNSDDVTAPTTVRVPKRQAQAPG